MNYKLVKELMTSPAIVIEESCSIKEAIQTMKQNNIGFLPVTKRNVIVGVVTDRDILLRAIIPFSLEEQVNKVMSSNEIHFVEPSTPLKDAAKIMAENKIRRLVVLNDGKVIGVLTTKNMLKEPSLLPYITSTYINNKTLNEYNIYTNSNPHDSLKTSDFPL